MTTLAIIFIVLGTIGAFILFQLVSMSLYTARLSMNPFNEKTKEHHAGFSWKWFWCKFQGGLIDMRSTIIVTSGGLLVMDWEKFINEEIHKKISPKIYETKDSVLYGSWAAPIRPARGYLRNFLFKTPTVGALMTMSQIDLQLSDYLAKKETEDALGEKRNISIMIGNFFGGNDDAVSSEHEENYGIVVGNPQLFDLNFGKKSQDAAEKLFEAKKFRESMEALSSEISDPEKRANAIFIANGLIKKNIFNLEGMEATGRSIAEVFASILTKK